MLAFAQHYALRWVSDHHSSLNPWTNSSFIFGKMFPGATTPREALLLNPDEWLRFTLHNILDIIPTIKRLMVYYNSALMIGFTAALLGLLAASVGPLHARIRSAGWWSALKTLPLLESGLYALPALTAVVLVYPTDHYAVILVAALIPSGVAIARWHSWSNSSDLIMALVVSVVIAMTVRPLPVVNQPTLKAIVEPRRLNLPIHRMLELDGGWCIYLT